MTPTEQDKELREKISHRFDSVCAEGHQQSCGEYQTAVDDVMQLITADRKRVALEGQLIAYESVKSGYSFIEWQRLLELRLKDGTKTPLWFVDRKITELKAQQEDV